MAISEGEPVAAGRSDRGVALLAAVWWTLIIAMLAVAASRETRTLAVIAANERLAAQNRAAADAGIAAAALALAAEARGLPVRVPAASPALADGSAPVLGRAGAAIPIDGRPLRWSHGEAAVTLTIMAERGRYDLNAGDPALLPAVLAAAGVRDRDAAAAQILARRQRGRDGRSIPWRIGDPGFAGPGELGGLPALSRAEIARLTPLVTTVSRRAAPDPALAPEALYRALPLDPDTRRRLDAVRAGPPGPPVLAGPEAFTITAVAVQPGGGRVEVSARLEVRPDGAPAVRPAVRPED